MYVVEWPCCHDPLSIRLSFDDLLLMRNNPPRQTANPHSRNRFLRSIARPPRRPRVTARTSGRARSLRPSLQNTWRLFFPHPPTRARIPTPPARKHLAIFLPPRHLPPRENTWRVLLLRAQNTWRFRRRHTVQENTWRVVHLHENTWRFRDAKPSHCAGKHLARFAPLCTARHTQKHLSNFSRPPPSQTLHLAPFAPAPLSIRARSAAPSRGWCGRAFCVPLAKTLDDFFSVGRHPTHTPPDPRPLHPHARTPVTSQPVTNIHRPHTLLLPPTHPLFLLFYHSPASLPPLTFCMQCNLDEICGRPFPLLLLSPPSCLRASFIRLLSRSSRPGHCCGLSVLHSHSAPAESESANQSMRRR